MSSDGPSKPRVPPPPTLSFGAAKDDAPGSAASSASSVEDDAWLELIEDEPTAPKDTATDSPDAPPASEEAEESTQGEDPSEDALTLASPPPPPTPTPARRGVLPPPKSEGKRVSPLSSKDKSSPRPKRPSAAGLPSGLRPPGAPEATKPEDTDVLIASAVAALTDSDAASVADESSAALPTADPVVLPASPPDAQTAAPTITATPDAPDKDRRLPVVWIGAFAAAAVLGLLALFSRGDAEPTEAPEAKPTVAAAAPAPPTPAPIDPEPAPSPEPAAIVEPRLDVGGDTPALDLGSDITTALDVGSVAEDSELELDAEQPEADEAAADRPANQRKRRKRKGSQDASTASPRPAPPTPAAAPDAKALLADARKALSAGQARRAYNLAAKSRRAKATSESLVVMAKAACRFGGEAQAKSAFNQLRVSDRRGIRAECRKHGVRLGL